MDKRIGIALLIGLFLLAAFSYFVIECGKRIETKSEALSIQVAEGVALHGCGNSDGAWIENTNNYPVRIRRVWQSGVGEKTKWVYYLEPYKRLDIKTVFSFDGFYIYSAEEFSSPLVGFISGKCLE